MRLSVVSTHVALTLLLAYCVPAAAAEAKPVPVTVASVEKKDVPVEISAFGRVAPLESVSVKSRVAALLMEVKAADGQRVRKGDLLFVLDKAPFEAAVAKAKATLEHDAALAENAAIEDRRQLALLRQNAISQDAYDSVHANNLAAAATKAMSAADLDNAQLQLGYCEITSPIDGALGRVEVKAGNLVDVGGVELATINRLSPIRASFSVTESRLADVRAAMAAGAPKVFASPSDGGGKTVEGDLAFIDNQVNADTGAITMEAEFVNADLALWPGQYVRVILRLSVEKGALIVPEQALHPVAEGVHMAAVVKDDNSIDMRRCRVERFRRKYGLS